MKKILLINGSPRKNGNTATLLNKALEGAVSKGADAEIIHLYDLDYKGCRSCFACKYTDSKSYGKCAVRDGLTPVIEKAGDADAVIIGSPVYLGFVTGAVHSLSERLLFPNVIYTNPLSSVFPGKLNVGLIFTMNIASRERMEQTGLAANLKNIENSYRMAFGHAESVYSMNTTQFDDYSRVIYEYQSVSEKEKARKEIFPDDCRNAYELGARFAD